MLRNIYLTSKYSDNLKELKDDATNMGTSSNTIQNQYIKLDDTPSQKETSSGSGLRTETCVYSEA